MDPRLNTAGIGDAEDLLMIEDILGHSKWVYAVIRDSQWPVGNSRGASAWDT